MSERMSWAELLALTTVSRCGMCELDHAPARSCAEVSRVQAIEAAEDHAEQVVFDAWRERGL